MKLILSLLLLVTMSANATGVVPTTAIRTTSVYSICSTKTDTIRNVSAATKKLVYAKAGVLQANASKYCNLPIPFEVDHIVALWDGGSNDITNLQLQSYCTLAQLTKGKDGKPIYKGLYDAHAKDAFEMQIHKQICDAKITPAQGAQQLYNWKN